MDPECVTAWFGVCAARFKERRAERDSPGAVAHLLGPAGPAIDHVNRRLAITTGSVAVVALASDLGVDLFLRRLGREGTTTGLFVRNGYLRSRRPVNESRYSDPRLVSRSATGTPPKTCARNWRAR